MTERERAARSYFLSGYNCAQSVAAAFADRLGMSEVEALRISAVLGAGFAALRGTCGAVMAAGLVISCELEGERREQKRAVYDRARSLSEAFAEEMGSCVCRELLGERASVVPAERTAEYYRERPCADCVAAAARLLERAIETDKSSKNPE